MARFAIFPVLVAFALLGAVGLLTYDMAVPEKVHNQNTERCAQNDKLCLVFFNGVRDITQLAYDVRRNAFSKQELPILKLYLSDGALRKLQKKRGGALAKPTPILMSGDDDWVKASIISDNGDKQEKVKASVRLKGDWGDHLTDPVRWSFRIKVNNNNYVFGLNKFSIQQPKVRNFAAEPLLLDMMRGSGVLAPRYFFVDVRLNDYRIGVMALEEHFSKELLESQDQREGPILAMDEDMLWKQWDLNRNGSDAPSPRIDHDQYNSFVNFFWKSDVPIKEFRFRGYRPGTIETNNAIRGQSLLRDYLAGQRPMKEVFALKLVAKWWVITNAWNGCHGRAWHNMRFYFNPLTDLLEPIAFDNDPEPDTFTFCSVKWVEDFLPDDVLLSNNDFVSNAVDFIEELRLQLSDPVFRDAFSQKQILMNRILTLSDADLVEVRVAELQRNLSLLVARLLQEKGSPEQGGMPSTPTSEISAAKPEIIGKAYQEAGAPMASHVTAFAYPNGDNVTITLKNLTIHPVEVTGLYRSKPKKGREVLSTAPFVLSSLAVQSQSYVKNIKLPISVVEEGASLTVSYSYQGEVFEQPVYVQFKNHIDGYRHDFFRQARRISDDIEIRASRKEIYFPKGAYVFTDSYQIPEGWRVIFAPGVAISFEKGARMKIQGPLQAIGTKTQPVSIRIASDKAFEKMGSWGGIFVQQSDEKSTLDYVEVEGEAGQILNNRQDYYGITGCLTFYESDVDISWTRFHDMQCEDALSFVRSSFDLDHVTFDRVRSDAVDSDFSTGRVTSSKFVHIGNDGIDISGTKLNAKAVSFEDVRDKAFSVGEKSHLVAADIEVKNTLTGIASKDLSTAYVQRARFSRVFGTGLLAYIKKKEYGPASIACLECIFEETANVAASQDGSRITLGDEVIPHKPFSHDQLVETGYVAR